MASEAVLEIYGRYKRVRRLQQYLRKLEKSGRTQLLPVDQAMLDYEICCDELEMSFEDMNLSLKETVEGDPFVGETVAATSLNAIEFLSTGDSFFSRMRSAKDLSSTFRILEFNALVYCGISFSDASAISKKVANLEEALSDRRIFPFTANIITSPIVNRYRTLKAMANVSISNMLSNLRQIEEHQIFALLLKANKEAKSLFDNSFTRLSVLMSCIGTFISTYNADIDLDPTDVPDPGIFT